MSSNASSSDSAAGVTTSGTAAGMADSRPALPQRLPHCEANELAFETGYDEPHVEGGISGTWMCQICKGLPRHPVYLQSCGHMFCEACVGKHYETWARPNPHFHTIQTAACPACRNQYSLSDARPFEDMDKWVQRVIKERVVLCPFDCGFKGDIFEVDEHQMYACVRRRLRCPHEGCTHEAEAQFMQLHFTHCPMLHVYCPRCRLSVLATEKDTHDCVKRLKVALRSMLTL